MSSHALSSRSIKADTGGLGYEAWRATNALTPQAMQGEAPPTDLIAAILSETSHCDYDDNGITTIVGRIRKQESGFTSLADSRALITSALEEDAHGSAKGRAAVIALAQRSFDVMCAAYHLSDAELENVCALYIYMGVMCVPYGGQSRYHALHYEHPDLTSRSASAHNSSFALATFPFGTDYLSANAHTFQDHLRGRQRGKDTVLSRTATAAWNAISGFVPHGAPCMPGCYEDALALIDGPHADLARMAVTPQGVWRVVAHAGVRFKEQYVSFDWRSRTITGAGPAVAPETLAVVAPGLGRK